MLRRRHWRKRTGCKLCNEWSGEQEKEDDKDHHKQHDRGATCTGGGLRWNWRTRKGEARGARGGGRRGRGEGGRGVSRVVDAPMTFR